MKTITWPKATEQFRYAIIVDADDRLVAWWDCGRCGAIGDTVSASFGDEFGLAGNNVRLRLVKELPQ